MLRTIYSCFCGTSMPKQTLGVGWRKPTSSSWLCVHMDIWGGLLSWLRSWLVKLDSSYTGFGGKWWCLWFWAWFVHLFVFLLQYWGLNPRLCIELYPQPFTSLLFILRQDITQLLCFPGWVHICNPPASASLLKDLNSKSCYHLWRIKSWNLGPPTKTEMK